MTRRPSTTRLAALALIAGLALAGCGGGGGGDDNGVASLEAAGDTDATTSTTLAPEDAMLAFAECMRDEGVDFPDPGADGRVEFRSGPGGDADFEAAQEACQHLAPRGRMSDEERAEMQDAAREVSKCLRERGWDVPDPEFDGDGGIMMRGPSEVDGDNPEFEADQRECSKVMDEFRPDGQGE